MPVEGQLAPDFTLACDGGIQLSLSQLRGQVVVLYFYPKDDTSGCTAQACALRDAWPDFQRNTATIIGVSRDSLTAHERFKEKHALPFPLGSDDSGELCKAYGVWVEKSMYGRKYMGIERSTFVIDGAGVICKLWRKVKVPGHAQAVLAAVAALAR